MTEYNLLFVGATPQALDAALKESEAPAVARSMDYLHTEDTDDTTMHFWDDAVSGTEVRLVEDHRLGCVYAVISGDDDGLAVSVRDHLRDEFAIVTASMLHESLRHDMAGSPNLFVQLTLCGDVCEESEDLILEGLRHPEPAVRRAAATAAGLLRTPRLLDAAGGMVEQETDEQTTRLLTGALRLAGRD